MRFRGLLALVSLLGGLHGCAFDPAGTSDVTAFDDGSIGIDARDAFVAGPDTIFPADDTATPDTTVVDSTFTDVGVADAMAPDTMVTVPDTMKPDTAIDAKPDVMPDVMPEVILDAGPCPVLEGGDLCAEIPTMTKTQIVDGIGDEFCDVKATVFDGTKGEHMVGTPTEKPLVYARLAWSSTALHAHFIVKDPSLHVGSAPALVWQGDGLELYVAGFAPLTGRFDDSKDKGAQQIVFAPAAGGAPARAEVFLTQVHTRSLLAPSQWAIRNVTGGYEIEVRLPWSEIGGTVHTVGTRIALDLAVSAKPNATDERFFSVLEIASKPTPSPCGSGTVEPSCDDRSWCTPVLK